ncbi:MAG TPA: hypothetical protein EYG35_00640 [Gammaproteobacteria bacterium]|nr:hypothetical protein [Gammaproteobacteria bacterium]
MKNTYALEMNAEVAPGYDENPFRLSDSLNSGGGWFVDTKFNAMQEFNDFRLRGSVSNRAYEGSNDDADIFIGKVDGRYKKKYKIGGKKGYSYLKAGYTSYDKTYIRRSTGKIATFSGQNNENRYDYDSFDIEAKTSIYLTKQLRTGLKINYLNKEYYDTNIAGISNLDYGQIRLSNDWFYKLNDQNRFNLNLYYAYRDFDNRRKKTLSGANIASTNLEYDYYSASLGYKYKFSPQLSSGIKASYIGRRDNGTGYYDTDDFKFSAELDYEINTGLNLATTVSYQDYNYVNGTITDEDDQILPDKEGYTIKFHLEKDLNVVKSLPLAVFTGVRYDDYDSKDLNFIYDRVQVFAGLKLKFNTDFL